MTFGAVNQMHSIKVNVEYCGACGHKKQFLEMADLIKATVPSAEVKGVDGREASFEIQVNDQLVYSKLQTLAFPDFNAVSDMIKNASKGEAITKVERQQPIECVIC